ncbi:MAG: sodium-dependent transporter [Erysipelotrichaceae bacterium]|nr:sodium-dependent transporter [Erysipelotrichaceae bacterium]MCI1326554.1 sodium-dependent transporter [Solobacterium sp.]MCH4044113.1 sodium-dependent transporter [Erysipelotrichaceae bacterium]MCH4121328.1 sodium-dependent transporter [Erysipelotrichaceae bacterium]MCI1363335.1 sodium-dependent transporter [Solobacterium sp.]
MKRDQFQSRLGFLLVSAGCAIGIGNVWKFPFVTGQNGGGIFVLFYLLFLIIMGIPVLTMELAIGRASRQSAVKGYKTLETPGSKFHIHGWFCAIGCYLLMMYYTTVSGWMLGYFFKFLTGTFTSGMSKDAVSGVFSAMLANPAEMTLWMAITVIAGFLIVAQGLQNGLERISRVMMVSLLCLIVVLAIHSLTLKGGMAGLQFYLLPSLTRAEEAGLGNVINAAMNQSFFTLSLGIGAMEIFGSYMSKDRTLASEAGWICVLDTFVAIVSGLIIFPACSAFGVQADAGPSLIFITLPNVFVNMAFGRLWGALFFLFMSFASFSTVIAVFENLNATLTDNFGITRKKASFINLVVVLLASLPCVLGFNVWSNFTIAGKGVLDIEDFLVSNLFLPLGSLVMVLFCSYRFGWGFDNYQKEANTGKGMKIPSFLKYYFRFDLPVLVLVILIKGLI